MATATSGPAAPHQDAAAPPADPTTVPPASPPCSSLLTGISTTLGAPLLRKIQSCRILLVGAGGIGCELLKNLALSGFRHVDVIDLDTIDVSNLNRQFLFRSRHVGMPKCTVASAAAEAMAPPTPLSNDDNDSDGGLRYVAHHGNVCDNAKFNVQFLSQFSLVLNALDNVTARRRVNRLCLASKVPLIEAGTTGYLGQVTVIDKGSGTECYECQTKPTQKVYPICTIRSTPSQPVHCIVWAKELYKLMFADKVEESMLYEDPNVGGGGEKDQEADGGEGAAQAAGAGGKDGEEKKDNGNANTNGNANGDEDGEDDEENAGPSTYMDLVEELRFLLKSPAAASEASSEELEEFIRSKAYEVLTALFATEITKQIDTGRYKTAQKVPQPLTSDELTADPTPPTQRPGYKHTDVWSRQECTSELVSCLLEASQLLQSPGGTIPPTFDKDDDLAMRFVTASSNLRQYVFGISPLQSHYSAKGIAGNIIPAIATTNAIVSGLQVLQAFHILREQMRCENGSNPSAGMSGSPSGTAGAGEGKAEAEVPKAEVPKVEASEGKASEGKAGPNLLECCRYTYCLRDRTRKGYYLQPVRLPPPNPKCFVCRSATVSVALDVASYTMEMLLRRIIKTELGFAQPTILIGGDLVYEEGDGAEEDYVCNLPKTLAKLPAGGIGHGTVVRVEDFTQDLEVDLCFEDRKTGFGTGEEEGGEEKDAEERFVIGGDRPVAAKKEEEGKEGKAAAGSGGGEEEEEEEEDDDDEIEVFDAYPDPKAKINAEEVGGAPHMKNGISPKKKKKRHHEVAIDDDEAPQKKAKASTEVEVIVLD